MLKALYDYAIRHELTLPAGYVGKTVKAYISLSDNSDYVGIVLGDGEAVPCPDIGSLAQGGGKSNVLVEKRSVVLPQTPNAKSEFFLEALKSAEKAEPMLETCAHALENPKTVEIIRKLLDNAKIKPNERISFMVNGHSVLKSAAIEDWWNQYRQQFRTKDPAAQTVCLITGAPTVPMVTTPPIQGLYTVGGHGRGDALICFDKTAFCSYDLKKAANAPVSEDAYASVKAALDDLLRDAPILAGMKFVHWYDRRIAREDDPIMQSPEFGFDIADENSEADDESGSRPKEPVNEAAMRHNADTVITGVKSGEPAVSLDDAVYYILLLTGVKSRVMIRRYEHGNYRELRGKLDLWQADLALIHPAGTDRLTGCKLKARLFRLLKYQKIDKEPWKRLISELSGISPAILESILTGGSLPDTVAAKALAYIRSKILSYDGSDTGAPPVPDARACQWLKVWLIRKNREQNLEEYLMEEYNLNHPNSAYHCGGVMAVYSAIQAAANPGVNAGVVQRYYAAASQTPALVLGQLSKLSNYHLDKIENKWLAGVYALKLQELYTAIGNNIPVTLSLEQQSYFALGYYQMWAKMNRERAERSAEKKRQDAARNDAAQKED